MYTPWSIQGAVLSICLATSALTCSSSVEPVRNTAPTTSSADFESFGMGEISVGRRDSIPPTILSEIGTWLAANFGLPSSKRVPAVQFVAQSRLVEIRYRDQQPSPDVSSIRHTGAGEDSDAIIALYDASGPTIFVTTEWRGDNPADRSVLVHEMVHHLQHEGRHHFGCPQARERVAYAAQDRWLTDHGLSLAEAFGVDAFTVLARSMCGH